MPSPLCQAEIPSIDTGILPEMAGLSRGLSVGRDARLVPPGRRRLSAPDLM
jgi:hypothetical protein